MKFFTVILSAILFLSLIIGNQMIAAEEVAAKGPDATPMVEESGEESGSWEED